MDGKRQAHSSGLVGREKAYGLAFSASEETPPEGLMLLIDPRTEQGNWGNNQQRVSGVRLEGRDGPILAYGTLDPKSLEIGYIKLF